MVLQIAFLVLTVTTHALKHPSSLAAGTLAVAGSGAAMIASLRAHPISRTVLRPTDILFGDHLTGYGQSEDILADRRFAASDTLKPCSRF